MIPAIVVIIDPLGNSRFQFLRQIIIVQQENILRLRGALRRLGNGQVNLAASLAFLGLHRPVIPFNFALGLWVKRPASRVIHLLDLQVFLQMFGNVTGPIIA